MANFAKILKDIGYDVVLFTDIFSPEITEKIRFLKFFNVYSLGTLRPAIKIKIGTRRFLELPRVDILIKLLRKEKVDTIMLFSGHYLVPMLKKMLPSLKIILYVFFPYFLAYSFSIKETYYQQRKLSRVVLKEYEKQIYSHADLIITISEYSRKILELTMNVQSYVIHEPIDTNFFKPSWEKKMYGLVISISQFMPSKRQDIMIQLFKKLMSLVKNKKDELTLVLAGGLNPYYIDYAKNILRSKYGASNLKILLNPSDEVVLDLYQRAYIYWHLHEEHHILTPLEAMACGTPAVLMKYGGIDGAVHRYNSMLANNYDEFVKYTIELIEDTSLWKKLAINAYRSVQYFSLERTRHRLEKLLIKELNISPTI